MPNITVTRPSEMFVVDIFQGNKEGHTSVTVALDWREADRLLTSLQQHMLDWHYEQHPADSANGRDVEQYEAFLDQRYHKEPF